MDVDNSVGGSGHGHEEEYEDASDTFWDGNDVQDDEAYEGAGETLREWVLTIVAGKLEHNCTDEYCVEAQDMIHKTCSL